FQDEIIRHTAVIPLGGNIITQDVREAFGLMRKQAEGLKVKHGSAYPKGVSDNEFIAVKGLIGRNSKEISKRNIANVIHARVEEIFDYACTHIRSSGFEKKLSAGIVVTGGGSMLKDIIPVIETVTGLEARVGYPTAHLTRQRIKDLDRELGHPSYATAIGLILEGYADMLETRIKENKIAEQHQQEPPL